MIENTNIKQFYPGPILNNTLEITDFLFNDAEQIKIKHSKLNEEDILVDIDLNYPTDYEVTKVLPSDINAAEAALTASTGQITLKNVNVLAGEKLTVYRVSQIIQDKDYPRTGAFPAATHEGALDYLTMQNQEQKDEIDRALKVPISTQNFEGSLPLPVPSRALKINNDGTGFEMSEFDPDLALVTTEEFKNQAQQAAAEALASQNVATEQATIATQQSELVASTANRALEDIEEGVETVSDLANELTNNAQNIINRLGINLFDTKISDHVLEGEEALGWALQGTYVYKEGVAGSRTGYADFYNKCLTEKELGTATETTLGDNTITMYVNANGHKFYDIADKTVVDNWYNIYGIADYYGVDTANERIFLPRNKYFAVTGEVAVAGNGMTLGLTDGTTNLGTVFWNSTQKNGNIVAGSAYGSNVGTSISDSTSATSKAMGLTTDPTKSGIEGRLTPNENKYLYICVGNTKVESAISNVTEITTSENDTLPLFYNFYSKEDMTTTGAYYNASLGEFLSGNIYTTAYNELVNKLGTGNVKANTSTYTDYDFVVNQDNMTFRLPLKNGQEIMFATRVKGNGITLGWTDGTNFAGTGTETPSGGNPTGVPFVNDYGKEVGATSDRANDLINGVTIGITTDSTKSGIVIDTENITIPDGWNLYYKVDNAVTNLELLDVAEVMNEAVLKSSLVEADVIVESYVNGTSGYNVYSNGYCEQWGRAGGIALNTWHFVYFLKEFKDPDYLLIGSCFDPSISTSYPDQLFAYRSPLQTTGFYGGIRYLSGGTVYADRGFTWKACGYIK